VHVIGFIIRKSVTMHGHMNVKLSYFVTFGLLTPPWIQVQLEFCNINCITACNKVAPHDDVTVLELLNYA
jgi:hypothetical protein